MDANPTLDQLQVFLKVAETGSFSSAARALNRAQSVISYTIANLEAQLQVELFDRKGARQPKLTRAGEALLTDARRLIADLEALRAKVNSIKSGVEAEISLAISVMVPSDAVVVTLRAFRESFPSVSLNLTVGELGMVNDWVRNGLADVGFSGSLLLQDDRVFSEKIGESVMVPVAAGDHPLVKLGRPLTIRDVREEVQIVVMDSSGLTKGRDFNVHSYRTWRVGDIATKHQLIRGGLGWGGLPISLVREDLSSGRLVALDLDAYKAAEYPIYVLRRNSYAPGPATSWLIQKLRNEISKVDEAWAG